MPRLRAITLKITRSHQDAEDLAQSTLTRALEARDQYDIGTNIAAWLSLVAINQWRSLKRREWRTVQMAEGQAERVPIDADPIHSLQLQDTMAAVACLPASQARVIMMAADGMSMEEIAEACGVQAGTIKSQLSRARTALEEYFRGSN